MEELLNSVTGLVTDALKSAGKFAEDTVDEYVKPWLDATEAIYQACLKQGMTPEDAADKTEQIIREATGKVII